jgi:hypothetical protein
MSWMSPKERFYTCVAHKQPDRPFSSTPLQSSKRSCRNGSPDRTCWRYWRWISERCGCQVRRLHLCAFALHPAQYTGGQRACRL